MGWTVYDCHGRAGNTSTNVVVAGQSEGDAANVDQAFHGKSSVLDRGAEYILHVHVPDSLLDSEQFWGWRWVHELGVPTYLERAWDAGYFCR